MSQQHPELTGMGTTVATILFDDPNTQASICHVGDSRVYRIRGKQIEQLTEDHSIVQQLLRDGKISPHELKISPHRHILSRAVGAGPAVQPAIRIEKPQPGDVFLLCSDGIHGVVEADELLDIVMREGSDLWRACDMLIDLVNSRGGPDNGTVMILHYDESPSLPPST
jgi:serine/threonine protein phosphatase PrpC